VWLGRRPALPEIESGALFRQLVGNHATEPSMSGYQVVEAIQIRASAAAYDGEVLNGIKARWSSVGPTDSGV
jgi:hypothetical protein